MASNLITSFKLNGVTYKIDHEALENLPTIATEITAESTDAEIPSAAAVYALVQASGGGGGLNYETSVVEN